MVISSMGLATKVFEFGNKHIKEHIEDINGFLRNMKYEDEEPARD